MCFNLIDIDNWKRKEYYLHYLEQLHCTYSLTTHIDMTALQNTIKATHRRIYPAQIHMLCSVVNQYEEFRMGFNDQGELGYWDIIHPSYTILNQKNETFSSIWSPYTPSFKEFYESYLNDTDTYSSSTNLTPKPNTPSNSFNISSLPWVNFTSFNINVLNNNRYLLPIFTLGKFITQEDKVLMPIAIQVHHAVCDGFHVGRFINALQERADHYAQWLEN